MNGTEVKSADCNFVTFYAARNGLGRATAAFNTAALLAASGEPTLLIDFDFDSPGLSPILAPQSEWGALNLFNELTEKRKQHDQSIVVKEKLEEEGHLIHYPLPERLTTQYPDGINHFDFLPSGSNESISYLLELSQFQQHEDRLLACSPEMADLLRRDLQGVYKHVLIYSPPGFTDLSFISVAPLGDTIVAFTGLGEQYRYGFRTFLEQLSTGFLREDGTGHNTKRLIPVISPVPNYRSKEIDSAKTNIKEVLDITLPEIITADRQPTELHFNPRLLHGVLPIIPNVAPTSRLSSDYHQLAQAIRDRVAV